MSDQLVNLKDAGGKLVSVPQNQVSEAVNNQGYTQATDADFTDYQNEQKYGDSPVKAAALGVAHGLAPGIAEQGMVRSGLVNPETIKQVSERNPEAYGTGMAVGVVAPAVLTLGDSLLMNSALKGAGMSAEAVSAMSTAQKVAAASELGLDTGAMGAAAKAASYTPAGLIGKAGGAITTALAPAAGSGVLNALGNVGAHAIGSSVEGAMFGAGEAVKDEALGDPQLNAEKVMGEIGNMAMFGGGVGAALGAAAPLFRGAKSLIGSGIDAVMPGSGAAAEGVTDAAAPKLTGKLGELQQMVSEANKAGENLEELGGRKILEDANAALPESMFPVTDGQLGTFDDPIKRKKFKVIAESDGEAGSVFRQWLGLQKREAVDQLGESISNVAPGTELTGDAHAGGKATLEELGGAYDQTKQRAGKLIGEIQKQGAGIDVTSTDVLSTVQKAFPDFDLGRVVKVGDDGALSMEAYNPKLPISKAAHSAISDIVDGLDKHSMTVADMLNVRNSIGDGLADLRGRPKYELGSLRKNMMDLAEGKLQDVSPEMPVRAAFKEYAQNEGKRDLMERMFGGELSNPRDVLSQIAPENVGDKVFRNSVSMSAAKQVLPPETFNKLVGNYLKEQIEKATKDGTFSSQKFATFLRANKLELGLALGDRPELVQRMNAAADKMRLLPDVAPSNPSGTADKLGIMEKFKHLGDFIANPGWAMTKMASNGILGKLGKNAAEAGIRAEAEMLLGGGEVAGNQAQRLGAIERTINKSSEKVKSLTSRIFDPNTQMVHSVKNTFTALSPTEKRQQFTRIEKTIKTSMANPDTYVNTVASSTKDIEDAAPNISQAMQVSMTRGAEFLKSKLPNTEPPGALSAARQPSDAELSKYFRYHAVVENPYIALKQVKDGTLTGDTMEALNAVYPSLLKEMHTSILDRVTSMKDGGKSLPYRTKVMLSAFLGSDLTGSANSQSMMANQASRAAPSQQQDAQGMGNKPSAAGMGKLTLAERSQGEMGKVMTRDRG